ncbi:MAG: hypothetical protein HQK49_03515 [Oligoflexia bacterium]|nr:hypothetical protein [Oligoflexia bacterium]
MVMQKEILKRYFELHDKPTLKFIAEDTRIQITRIFRILNGHEMRVSEYEKFELAIRRKLQEKEKDLHGIDGKLLELAKVCGKELSSQHLRDIASFMNRKLKIKLILKQTN